MSYGIRKIKFRAFWKDTLELVEDFNTEYLIDACNDPVFIVHQFTGLKDKNGKEIYEGDFLSSNGFDLPITVSDYHGYRFVIGEQLLTRADAKHGEVIGNIYENPELLK